MSDIKYKLSFDIDKRGIVGIQQDLDDMVRKIHEMSGGQSGFTEEVREAFRATELLKNSLTNAHNSDLGRMNTKKFTKELQAAGTNLREIEYKLNKVGASGGQAFDNLNKNIRQTGVEVKHTSKLMDSMFDTIGKTVKWSIASQMMNQLGGSVQRAIGFTKGLDESLNNIQVVSGKNATEMKVFADEANNAAQALGKSTTEYTDASLIFFQQGKSAEEVRMLTEATLKGANVTGTEVAEMAELLTAVMNGYGISAEHALATTDKLAAVGAATGADFEELATGMSKVASMADIAGVSVDQLGAQLATITTVTKEAPESIGTSLKTIYGRIAEIKVGKADEEGWDLGKVEDAFNKVGLTVLNANRQMKDVGAIMEEIGPMWKDFNRESQLGLANAMAGQRQANRLIALFNNWEMYTDALNVSQTSLGATTEQNEIRMESMSYKSKQLRTEIEQLWMNLINSDFLKAGTDLLSSTISGVNNLVESINGVGGALTLVGGIALAVFGRQIGTSLDTNLGKIGEFSQKVRSIPDSMKEKKDRKSGKMSQEDEIEYDSRQKQKQEEKIVSQGASKEDKKRYNEALEVSQKKIELKEIEALKLQEIRERMTKFDVEGDKQVEIANKKAMEISKKKVEMEAKAAKAQRTHDTEKRLSLSTAKNIAKEGEGLSYQEQLQVMTDAEKKNLGMTDAELAKFTSLEDVITRIKRATVKDGLISTQQDMVEVKALEREIENLEKDRKKAVGKAKDSFNEVATIADDEMKSENTIARLENDAKESSNIVSSIVDESTRKLKSINFTKIAGTAAAAFAIAGPAIGVFFDDASSKAEKLEASFDMATSAATALGFLIGGPLGAALAGAAVSLGKLVYENTGFNKLVKDNTKTLDTYRNSMKELTDEQNTLSNALTKMGEAEAIAADGLDSGEYEKYQDIINEIATSSPQVVAYYDAFGNAVLKSREEVEKLNASLKEQAKLNMKTMSSQAGSFASEVAYLQTEGKTKEAALNEKLQTEVDSLNEALAKGNEKKIDKARQKISDVTTEITELRNEFSALGAKTQEAIIDPFIQGEEIFKDMGEELQGFIGSVFNTEEIQKGLSSINRDGSKSISVLDRESTAYLNKFKEGITNVASAFTDLGREAEKEGGKVAATLKNNLAGLPADVQKMFGENLTQLSLSVDQNTLKTSINEAAKYIDEQGELDSFGMIEYFRRVGMTAKQEIEAGIRGSLRETLATELEATKELFGEGTAFTSIQDRIKNDLMGAVQVGKLTLEQVTTFMNELNSQNMSVVAELLTNNSQLTEQVLESLRETSEGTFDWTDLSKYSEELIPLFENIANAQAEVEQLNASFGDGTTIFSTFAEDLAESIDGQIEIVELWNEMVASTEEVGEGGLFSMDIAAMEEQVGILRENAEGIDALSGAAEDLSKSEEELVDVSKRVGEAFSTMSESMGQEGFKNLVSLTGKSVDEIQRLAEAAKNGSLDAARTLQREMGKVYGALNKDNRDYFNTFKDTNKDKLRLVADYTNIEAKNYGTLAEYQERLEFWKAENAGKSAEQQTKTVNDALMVQVNNMGDAAKTSMMINGDSIDGAGRAAAIAQLVVVRSAVESAKAGGQAGQDAASAMISSLNGVNEAIGMTIGNVTKYLDSELTDFDGLLQRIDAEIAKYAGGGVGKGGATVPPINLGGVTMPNFDDFNYTPPSGSVSAPSYTPSGSGGGDSGGSGPSVGSGGGGGKEPSGPKEKEEKEVEDLEWEEDIYHDINIELEKKAQLLELLQKEQDKLYGKELMANLAKQKVALQEQEALYRRKLEMQKQDLSQQKSLLATAGAQFNVDGTIANYNALLKQKLAYVNSLSGEAKEAAKEEFSALTEMLEKYEEMMMNTIFETENAIQDAIDAQREIFIQEFEYVINFKIELSGDLQDALDFQKDMTEGFGTEAADYESTTIQLKDQLALAEEIKIQIDAINNRDDLTDKERIEMLEAQSKNLKDAVKEAKKLEEELTKIFEETLKKGLETTKEHLDNFKDINNELKHLEQMLQLIGEKDNYAALDRIYEEQYDATMGQIDTLNQQKAVLQAQKDALEAAGMKGSKEWEAVDEAIRKTGTDINSLAQESLKLLQKEFKNSVDEIMSTLEKSMTGGKGFEELKKQQKEIKEERKKYLDGEEKLIEVNKLQKKLQKEIDATNDPAKKAKLQKFMDTEMKALKEKDKLSKHDVDRANLVYDLTLKQMALEEQRAAKNTMRLVRDTQGNWVYEFTEDAQAVQKAQEDVSSALEALSKHDKKRLEETQDEMLKLQEEYYKEVQKITQDALAGKYKTEDEYQAALEAVTNKYNEKMMVSQAEYEEAKRNATLSSMAVILDSYVTTGNELAGLTDEQQEAMRKLAEAVEGDYAGLKDAMDAILNGDEDSIKKAFGDLGIDVSKDMTSIIDAIGASSTIMKDGWGLNISDMIGDMIGEGGFKESSAGAISSIMDKWDEYKNKMEVVQDKTGTSLGDITSKTEAADKATEDLKNETQSLIDTLTANLGQVTSWTTAYNSQRETIKGLIKDTTDYIAKLDELIKKKKEEASGVTGSGGSGSGSGSGGSGSGGGATPPKPTPPPAPTPPPLKVGSKVKVKPGRRWYYDSMGMNPSGQTDPYAGKDLQITTTNDKGSYPLNVGAYPGNYLGWLKKDDLVGYRTGGYTGKFENPQEGKIAMLHEKELILNSGDTENMLEMLKTVRGKDGSGLAQIIANTIANSAGRVINAISALGNSMSSNSSQVGSVVNSENFEQSVVINADFSGVKSSEEIEAAFNGLSTRASQYAMKK